MHTPTLNCTAILATILLAGGVATAQVDNDSCVGATLVGDGTPAIEGDNAPASAADDAEASCQLFAHHDVWFEYTATCNGAATVDTFGSGQSDTVLSVYDACGGNEIACNDDTAGLLSQVTFGTTANQSYWIRMASFDAPGDYDLNITCIGVPGNDDCASAEIVSDGVPAAEGDNSQASAADGVEASCQFSNFDVWFAYTPTCVGTVTVDTFGSGQLDTVLSVFDACIGNEIACDDDTGGLLSHVSFDASAAPTVFIRLASFGAPGDYDVNITCTGEPVNDSCGSPSIVSEGIPTAEGNNSQASGTDDDEASCQSSDFDVWFQYTALASGTVSVDTFGSEQSDTVLSAYDACSGAEIACNDDTGDLLSQITFATTTSQSYLIRLASFDAPGDYDLNITHIETPSNDECTTAMPVNEGTPAAEGDNTAASAVDDHEASCQLSDSDVWFSYAANCSGVVTVDTFGSEQSDTVLSVYESGCPDAAPEIACDDDTMDGHAQVTFQTTAPGWLIRLASFGPPGDYDLNITCTPTPPNDACASATMVADGTPAAEGDNTGASATDDDEASCQFSDFDVWFQYSATCTGAATVDTFGSGQSDTVLSVYDACAGNEVACNDDTGGPLSQVIFATTLGQSHWIRLASLGAPADFDLNIECTPGPPNDDCLTATAVSDGIPAAEGDNSQASGTDDDEAGCQFSDFDVWFRYLAVCDGPVTVDTFDSGQEDTVLSVYEGCGDTEIACNDDADGSTHSQVTFEATEMMEYRVRLGSFGTPGDYDLNIVLDDCNANGLPDCLEVNKDGLIGSYHPFPDFAGTPVLRVDPTIDFDWGSGEPSPGFGEDNFSVRWTGYVLTEPAAGTYTFTTWADDGVRLWVDGQLLIDDWTIHPPAQNSGVINLDGSTEYPIKLEYFEATGGAVAQLSWTPPGGVQGVVPAGNLTPSQDCDDNGVPDECDPDTDADGIIDDCDLCPETPDEIDDCANALHIGEGTFGFCNVDATLDGPLDCGGANMSRDIWFRYVAPTTGLLTIDTCAEQVLDTILAVYTGDCGALTLEGCDNDGCEVALQSIIANLPLVAGQEILIRIGAHAPDLGSGVLTVGFCLDDDEDGVCNEDDICPGFDDNGPDADGDGVPDDCDACAGGAASGDSDADGGVDLDDHSNFDACLLGPGAGLGIGCECFDFDDDGDNDLLDFAGFQAAFTGS